MSLIWYAATSAQGAAVQLAEPLSLTVMLPAPAAALASDDRPTGLTAKLFQGTDLVHPVAVLTGARGRKGRIALSDAGTGEMTIPNRHPDRALVASTDTVRYELDGQPIHQWIVTSRRSATLRADQAERVTTLAGSGTLGLLAECPVLPTLGPGRKPIERDRGWGWFSPSPIFDDSLWPSAHQITATTTDWWSGVTSYPGGLGGYGWWIWGPQGTIPWAPEGDCYFRKTFTLAEATRAKFFYMSDDRSKMWVDGQLQLESKSWTNSNESLFSPEFDLSAGTHTIAVWAQNNPGQLGNNPAGIRGALYPVTPTGEISGSPILVTDSTWKCLAYPLSPPGMTIGEVLYQLFEEWQSYGLAVGWELDFTRSHDTGGRRWPIGEFGTKVGTDGRTFIVDELASTYIDVAAYPGGTVLAAWLIDTAGRPRALDLHAPTDRSDPTSGTLLELDHDEEASTASGLLVLTEDGWLIEDATPDGQRKRWALLGLGAQPSEAAARTVARGEIERVARARVAITAEPTRGIDIRDADVGDTITVPDWDLAASVERVLAWTFEEDEHGTLTWTPELKDPILTMEERAANTSKKMADGTMRGRSKAATPVSQIDTQGPSCCPAQPPLCS